MSVNLRGRRPRTIGPYAHGMSSDGAWAASKAFRGTVNLQSTWKTGPDGKPIRPWLVQAPDAVARDGISEHRVECLACSSQSKEKETMQSKIDTIKTHERKDSHQKAVKQWEAAQANKHRMAGFFGQMAAAQQQKEEAELPGLKQQLIEQPLMRRVLADLSLTTSSCQSCSQHWASSAQRCTGATAAAGRCVCPWSRSCWTSCACACSRPSPSAHAAGHRSAALAGRGNPAGAVWAG